MDTSFEKVRDYLLELELDIVEENNTDSYFIVHKEEEGINQMMIVCDAPILIMEQHLFNTESTDPNVYKKLLQMNRNLVHGAFVMDEAGDKVIFRDTLQLESLDLNEIQASINSLVLMFSEYREDLISMSK